MRTLCTYEVLRLCKITSDPLCLSVLMLKFVESYDIFNVHSRECKISYRVKCMIDFTFDSIGYSR